MASNDQLPMRERSVQCLGPHGLHRMAYREWGDPGNKRVLICVHGLSRNGRDFDFLASRLCRHYRVVCPDVVGRGRSDWLPVKDHYAIPTYVNDMVTLIARLDVETVHWVGTSMGGLIGMTLASLPGNPITRLVLNDVGPVITAVSLKRLGEYLGQAPTFASFEEAERYVRTISAPFGDLSDEQWRHLTENVVRPAKDGGYEMHYDPGIAEPFRKAMGDEDVSLWPVYDAVRCPTLVVRGAQSDLLPAAALAEMARRGPAAQVVEIPDVGHAPMFLDDMQVNIVRDFLLQGQETP
ncbi:MAG: alpha/beta fold hydrolase [Pseudomonadota bacterium]